jgi:hypothetical protein
LFCRIRICLSFDVDMLGSVFQVFQVFQVITGSRVVSLTQLLNDVAFLRYSAHDWTEWLVVDVLDVWCNFFCNPSFFYESLRPFRALHVEI